MRIDLKIEGYLLHGDVPYLQELIFTSLCAVLERNGTDVDLINVAMRICISDTNPRNLKQLRYGAVWANRMIVDVSAKDGWDCYRATDKVDISWNSVTMTGVLFQVIMNKLHEDLNGTGLKVEVGKIRPLLIFDQEATWSRQQLTPTENVDFAHRPDYFEQEQFL